MIAVTYMNVRPIGRGCDSERKRGTENESVRERKIGRDGESEREEKD